MATSEQEQPALSLKLASLLYLLLETVQPILLMVKENCYSRSLIIQSLVVILPDVLYGYESCPLVLRKERRLKVLQNMLVAVYVIKRDTV